MSHIKRNPNTIRPPFAQAKNLAALAPAIRHGFFGRQGGVSQGIYASLNVGLGSADDPDHVRQNRSLIAQCFDLPASALLSLHQVHSADVLWVDSAFSMACEAVPARPKADGMVTRQKGLALSALSADCVPILLADPLTGTIGAVHAGWRGALAGIIDSAIRQFRAHGAQAAQLVAAIGPAIAQASYEVGPDLHEKFLQPDAANAQFFAQGRADRWHFDLKGYCAAQLRKNGVVQIETLADDTCAQEDLYFSNRRAFQRAEADYGRNLSVILLTPDQPGA